MFTIPTKKINEAKLIYMCAINENGIKTYQITKNLYTQTKEPLNEDEFKKFITKHYPEFLESLTL